MKLCFQYIILISIALDSIRSIYLLSRNLTLIIDFSKNTGIFYENPRLIQKDISKIISNSIQTNVENYQYFLKRLNHKIIKKNDENDTTFEFTIPNNKYVLYNNKFTLFLNLIFTNLSENYFLNRQIIFKNKIIQSSIIIEKSNYLRKNNNQNLYRINLIIDDIDDGELLQFKIIKKNMIKNYSFKQSDLPLSDSHRLLSNNSNFTENKANSSVLDALINILILMCFCWDCYLCFSTPNDQLNQAFNPRDNVLTS